MYQRVLDTLNTMYPNKYTWIVSPYNFDSDLDVPEGKKLCLINTVSSKHEIIFDNSDTNVLKFIEWFKTKERTSDIFSIYIDTENNLIEHTFSFSNIVSIEIYSPRPVL